MNALHQRLTAENYNKGFLVDDELMAGVTELQESPGHFAAFVVRPESGEYLGYTTCQSLESALNLINRIPRDWIFESTSGCDGSKCEEGKCKGDGCKIFDPKAALARSANSPDQLGTV